jgi:ATP-dependent helicase/nuclease subunit B
MDTPSSDTAHLAPQQPAVGSDLGLQSWDRSWAALWAQVSGHMQALGAHSARTVVLLPFFQLQKVARDTAQRHWTKGDAGIFLPRLETTKSWSQRVGHFMPGPLDISFDAGLDSLRANTWLQRAGLKAKQSMLSGSLVQTAHQLGALVAAVPPAQRSAWAQAARGQVLLGTGAGSGSGSDSQAGNPLVYEAAVARIALEWAVASRYASDVLFGDALHASLDALVVVQGLQANPLASALAQHWQAISSTVVWAQPHSAYQVALHAAAHAHEEADRAAQCVLQHISQGRVPVALAAVDRVTTRRISATLQLQGVALQDETGWKLSTTRAAASLMALLRAARWRADPSGSQDALLDWLKHTNAPSASVNALEMNLRKKNGNFSDVDIEEFAINFIVNDVATQLPSAVPVPASELLGSLRASRSALQWLASVRQALQASGQWGALMADAAGRDCVQALHLLQPDLVADVLDSADTERSAQMSLAEFSAWASECLENASFKPTAQGSAALVPQVVVLPLAQVLARPFAALVVAAADEQRLGASPEPVGHWTSAQRQALGLASRSALAAELEQVWQSALRAPSVDVLWRAAEGEQSLQPSPLLQRWLLDKGSVGTGEADSNAGSNVIYASDPRREIRIQAAPIVPPQPTAHALRIASLSASSYSDLRTCPYRFFALRLLGLQDAAELDTEIDKRDFGSWLHSVLAQFHVLRKGAGSHTDDAALLDQCALEQRLPDAGFVPFAAAWPQVRESYLLWLAQHEAEGWQFDQSELERSLPYGAGQSSVHLKGRLDRVDRLSRGPEAGTAYVLDYKTESVQTSKDRVKNPHEDTQLAFYAALLGEDDLHAAYVNLAERSCSLTAQPEIMAARDALLGGISIDVERIHAGHAMPALGEGAACDYCAARGLCRKDMWTL